MAKKTFEQSLEQLEQIVDALESGELPLEQALKKFEEGMKISRWCAAKLDETEKKVNVLLKDQENKDIEVPFSTEKDA